MGASIDGWRKGYIWNQGSPSSPALWDQAHCQVNLLGTVPAPATFPVPGTSPGGSRMGPWGWEAAQFWGAGHPVGLSDTSILTACCW